MSDLRHSLFPAQTQTKHQPEARPLNVGVIGGGISGLTAAYELTRIGYRVTVLERAPDIGGMCTTLSLDGHHYDLGGHLISNSYHTMRSLLQELDLPLAPTYKAHFLADDTGNIVNYQAVFQQFGQAMEHFRRLKQMAFAKLSLPGLAHTGSTLGMPTARWLQEHLADQLYAIPAQTFAGAGYGFINAMDIPALYFLKFLDSVDFLGDATHSATVTGGLANLYRRLAERGGEVRCSVDIQRIERAAKQVAVVTAHETLNFDKIILAIPLPAALPLLDATAEEQALFSQIRTIDYYTTVCTVKGCPRKGLYFLTSHMTHATMGKPLAYYHQYDETDICVFFSYGDARTNGANIIEQIEATVRRLGGDLVSVHHQQAWPYFPHVSSQAVQQGYYPRLEALQGQQHTFYVGSLFNFELMDCNIAYSRELVRQHFPPRNGQAARESASATQAAGSTAMPAGHGVSAEAIQERLTLLLADPLRIPPHAVDVHKSLTEYGLDSLAVVEIFAQLSEWLARSVSPALMLEAPTIVRLAEALATDGAAAPAVAPPTLSPRSPGWVARHLISVFGRMLAQPFYLLALFAMGVLQLLVYQFRRMGELAPLEGFVGDLLYIWDSALLEFDPYQWQTRRLRWFGGRRKMFLALNQVFVAGAYADIKRLLTRPQRKTGDWLGYRRYEGNDFRLNSPLVINLSDGPHEQVRATIEHMLPQVEEPATQTAVNSLLAQWLDKMAAETQQGLRPGFTVSKDLITGYTWLLHRLICQIELTPEELANSAVYIEDGIFVASYPARFVKDQPDVLRPFAEHRRLLIKRYQRSPAVQTLLAPFVGQFPEMALLNGVFDVIHAAGVPGLALASKAVVAEVVRQPALRATLEAEIRQAWDGRGAPPVAQMPLLQAAVLEAVRLYPPVWASSQVSGASSENHVWGLACPIKPKTQLTASIWLSGYDETVFGSAPTKFDLHRDHTGMLNWNEANPQRVCPAKDLSLLITQMLVAQMLVHYRWQRVQANGAPLTAANTTQFTLQGFARKTAPSAQAKPTAKTAAPTTQARNEPSALAPLDLTARATQLPRGEWLNPRAILLTGGSGFVGAYLIASLLHHSNAELYCLVRAASEKEGRARLQQALEKYGLWSAEAARRVFAVPGDLAQPELGLDQASARQIAAQADVIVHAGAHVNWFYPYEQLAAANVDGTRAVLQLAVRERLKAVHYVSTLGITYAADHGQHQLLREDDPLELYKSQRMGYLQSKWAAETLAQAARDKGVPITVYRPPYITSSGAASELAGNKSFLLQSVRGSIQLGLFPDRLARSDLVSVEYLAEAIARLMREPTALNATLNFLNPVDWTSLLATIQDRGYALRRAPTAEWLAAIHACGPENPLYLYKGEVGAASNIALASTSSYDNRQTTTLLERVGLRAQPSANELLNTYLGAVEGRATPPMQR